jgi:formate dehydrogenase major subunit
VAEIRLIIDGKEVKGEPGQTILEAANNNGIEIPTLCYDKRMEPYGGCGLCVVEAEGNPKLLRSCATEIKNGMVIHTGTQRVIGSRKLALELLLSDHVGDCYAPCRQACPASVDSQGYVGLIANGRYGEAIKLIKEQIPLPASIGRVCPHPCEDACRRMLVEEPIALARLKQFAADWDLKLENPYLPKIKPNTGKKVAIIGGGPAGLTAGFYLAIEGHQVIIFEAMPKAGGMLRYGIPQYRLPKDVLDREIEIIEKIGVEIKTGIYVGKDIKYDDLRNNYDALYIAIGAWGSSALKCPGEDLKGVYGSVEFLQRVAEGNPPQIGRKVAVIGGGNTAIDASRTALRLGAKEVHLLYRRSRAEMPAVHYEIKEAEEEGVEFHFLVSPLEIMGEKKSVKKIKLQQMKLGKPGEDGRKKPEPIPGAEVDIEVDTVIAALGQKVVIPEGFNNVLLTKSNTIIADSKTFMTNIPGVFAGGDAVNEGPDIAIKAIGDAKKAANAISGYLKGKIIRYQEPYYVQRTNLTEKDIAGKEKKFRPKVIPLSPEDRINNFQEIIPTYSEEGAQEEALRCLECGCGKIFECRLVQYAQKYQINPDRVAGETHQRRCKTDHPFIERDPNKCILCGLCVRVCDDIMGIAVLGLVNRGFDTVVQAEFNLPLKETDCLSCGQCIEVCPTGALQERLSITKPVPLSTTNTRTICSFCSVGCNIILKSRGNLLVKSVPDQESKVVGGILCVKGKFGFNMVQKGFRLTQPLIQTKGELREASWDDALGYIASHVLRINKQFGGNSLAVSVSDRYTNEEIYLALKLAREVLNTPHTFSFNGFDEGLIDVLGYDASSSTFEELLYTDTILLIGSDIMKNHIAIGVKIKEAVKNGTKLIVINPGQSLADEWAFQRIYPENNVIFLKEVLKAIINMGFTPSKDQVNGFEEFKESLHDVIVSKEAEEVAEIYAKSHNSMIVFEQSKVTENGAKLIADLAVLSGHIGSSYNGIIQLKPNANSQGLRDMGVAKGPLDIIEKMKEKTIKGLFIFGEDITGVDFSNLDLLVVQDTHMTKTAKSAHVVLPGVGYEETDGTFTSAERRIQKLHRAIQTINRLQNWEVMKMIAQSMGSQWTFQNSSEIFREIKKNISIYCGLKQIDEKDNYWPGGRKNILYSQQYHFPDGKAQLQTVNEGPLFQEKVSTNHLENSFLRYLKNEKIY